MQMGARADTMGQCTGTEKRGVTRRRRTSHGLPCRPMQTRPTTKAMWLPAWMSSPPWGQTGEGVVREAEKGRKLQDDARTEHAPAEVSAQARVGLGPHRNGADGLCEQQRRANAARLRHPEAQEAGPDRIHADAAYEREAVQPRRGGSAVFHNGIVSMKVIKGRPPNGKLTGRWKWGRT